MNQIDTTPTARLESAPRARQRLCRLLAFAVLIPFFTFVAPQAASAERDSSGYWCISVNGTERSCSYVEMNWGSGWSWRANAHVDDVGGGDGYYSQVEVMLNRKGMSNTPWMYVARAYEYRQNYQGVSGYDPTYGAWVRQCIWPYYGGSGFCSTRYWTDNS